MVQGGCGLGFTLKSGERLRITGDSFRQEFQCNETMKARVLSLVDHTHPAAAQLLDNAVMRDGLADHEWAQGSACNVRDARKTSQREMTLQSRTSCSILNAKIRSAPRTLAKHLMYSQAVLAVEEYKRRLKDRECRVARYEQIHIRLGYVRLLLALATSGIAWESLKRHALSLWWIVVPLILFVLVAAYHFAHLAIPRTSPWWGFLLSEGIRSDRRPLDGYRTNGRTLQRSPSCVCSRSGLIRARRFVRTSLNCTHTYGGGDPRGVAALAFDG